MTTNTRSEQPRTWLVTGASSGIGLALVRAAAGRGENVIAIARHVDVLEPLADQAAGRVLARAADVTDREAIDRIVADAVERFGRIDVVANNAGYGAFGAVEEATAEQARALFETNVFGVLNVLWATLPQLRAQGSGHILQGSSYLGQTAHAGLGLLAATKYAVEGVSDALAEELEPLGIHVTLVAPSLTATPLLSRLDVSPAIPAYDGTVRALLRAIGELPPSAYNDPARVAEVLIAAVDADTPPRRLAIGSQSMQEIRAALDARLEQLDRWAELSASADGQLV